MVGYDKYHTIHAFDYARDKGHTTYALIQLCEEQSYSTTVHNKQLFVIGYDKYGASRKSLNKRLMSGRILRLLPPTHWTQFALRSSACICIHLPSSAYHTIHILYAFFVVTKDSLQCTCTSLIVLHQFSR